MNNRSLEFCSPPYSPCTAALVFGLSNFTWIRWIIWLKCYHLCVHGSVFVNKSFDDNIVCFNQIVQWLIHVIQWNRWWSQDRKRIFISVMLPLYVYEVVCAGQGWNAQRDDLQETSSIEYSTFKYLSINGRFTAICSFARRSILRRNISVAYHRMQQTRFLFLILER